LPEFWRRSKPDMSLLRNTASGLRSLFRKEHVDQELDEELRTYLEMSSKELSVTLSKNSRLWD
jgi:hypothetical protein